MKTLKIAAISLVALLLLVLAFFILVGLLEPKLAGVMIETSPSSTVYLNGTMMGKTPFKGTHKPGEVVIKLIPDGGDLLPYEIKNTLLSGIQTVIRREFGITEDTSSGDVVSFDKTSPNETNLVAISIPGNAQISLDGVPRGFTPYKTSTISPAEHQITIKAPGYVDRIMTLKSLAGYRLTIFVKLAKSPQTGPSESEKDEIAISSKEYVEILNTSTGFLRVRTEPGTKGEEIAEVKPGQRFLYLETDSEWGWHKIRYQEPLPGLPNGIVGWVPGEFSKIIKDSSAEPVNGTVQSN